MDNTTIEHVRLRFLAVRKDSGEMYVFIFENNWLFRARVAWTAARWAADRRLSFTFSDAWKLIRLAILPHGVFVRKPGSTFEDWKVTCDSSGKLV